MNRRKFLKLAAAAPLAALALDVAHARPRAANSNAPNFLILVFDTLSAPHTNLQDYKRNTTPNMARFAEHANVYHRHYSGGNFTSPGTASLLTGTLPWTHRAFQHYSTVKPEFENRNIFSIFHDAGYYRVAYTHNPLAAIPLKQFRRDLEQYKPTEELYLNNGGLSEKIFLNDSAVAQWAENSMLIGGDRFHPTSLFGTGVVRLSSKEQERQLVMKYGAQFPVGLPEFEAFFLLEDAINWVQALVQSMPQPYLAYVHLLPPHGPSRPRIDFYEKFRDGWRVPVKPTSPFTTHQSDDELFFYRRLYDEYIGYADAEFGRLYDFLDQNRVFDNTYVMLTSDHGELTERGIYGHITEALYDQITHVPLVIRAPGQTARQDFHSPTSCLDLTPTLAKLLGAPAPAWAEGTLLPGFGGAADNERNIFTVEAKKNPRVSPLRTASVALVKGADKLIHTFGYPGIDDAFELYDLENDPDELNNLTAARPELAADLKNQMQLSIQAADAPYIKA